MRSQAMYGARSQTITFVAAIFMAAAICLFAVPRLFADEQEKPKSDGPIAASSALVDMPLTKDEIATMTIKMQAAQLRGQAATPQALGAEIAKLIETRLKEATDASQDANQFYQSLQREGYVVNLQTMTRDKVVKK